MSFSKEIEGGNKKTIVPEFERAAQISEEEALRIRIAAIADDDQRQRCTLRLDYAQGQSRHMEETYTYAEARYVDEHLKLDPTLGLEVVDTEKTYEQRVEELKHAYAQSQDGQALRASIDASKEKLWDNVRNWADAYAPPLDPKIAPDARMQTPDRSPLRPAFLRTTIR